MVFLVFVIAMASAIIILHQNQMDSVPTFVPSIVTASFQTSLLMVHPSCLLHKVAASMFHIILTFPCHQELNYIDLPPPSMSTDNTIATSAIVIAST